MARAIQGIHYVDFHGDMQTAACTEPTLGPDGELAIATTVFMSSATCEGCRRAIQNRLDVVGFVAIPGQLGTTNRPLNSPNAFSR